MPETPTTPPAPNAGDNNGGTPPANANGNEPGKNGNEGGNQGIPDFEPSRLSDEQLKKVLEDQRLWETDRLKQLREQAKKGKDYESQQQKDAEALAIKKGEFDKVLAEKDAKIAELEQKLQGNSVDSMLRTKLQEAGVKNIEAALRIVERNGLKLNEAGQLEGVEGAIESLKKLAPELLSSTNASLGGGTNPPNPGSGGKVKMSDLRNATWFNDPANAQTIKDIQAGKIQVEQD